MKMEKIKELLRYFKLAVIVIFAVLILPILILKSLITSIFSGRFNKLDGKTVLITGAGNGLGRAMTRQLVKKKCRVIAVDMKKTDLDDTIELVNKENEEQGMAVPYVCDITDIDGVNEMRDWTIREFGKVDLLINNAGFLFVRKITDGSSELIKRCFDVNVLGAIWVTQAFLPAMKEKKSGQILFINSVGGLGTDPILGIYCCTKFALSAYATALDQDLRKDSQYDNIKITSVHPWIMKTQPNIDTLYRGTLGSLPLDYAVNEILEGTRRQLDYFIVPGGQFGARLARIFGAMPKDFQNLFYKAAATEGGQLDERILQDMTSPTPYKTIHETYKTEDIHQYIKFDK